MGLARAHEALAGKVAVVVGGAAGFLGRGVTMGLARSGVAIACCDNDREGLAAIVPEVEAGGTRILAHEADVADEGALLPFFDAVRERFGRIDILVNVVGGVERGLFADKSREQDARDIRLNYGYVIDSIRAALPLMRAHGEGGSIVNFTSIEAHRGAASFAVYAGAKAATMNFSRALAVELAAEQIRVNCIATDTSPARASNNALSPADMERLAGLDQGALDRSIHFYVPQKQAPSVDDVVNGVLFLVSDLSRAITGTTLHIDGGTSAALGFLDWPYGDGFMPAPLGGSIPHLFGDQKDRR